MNYNVNGSLNRNVDPFGNEVAQSGNPSNSILSQYTVDITNLAKEGKIDLIKCRDAEISKLLKTISRRKKNNALLLGKPGTGKTSIVEGLAQKIINKDCSPFLYNKRILSLDIGLLLAGTKFRGDFEERMSAIIAELKENRDIILFIDEIHLISGAGGSVGNTDLANLIKPALARGEFQCIGATTLEEYKKYFRTDKALDRRFNIIDVREPTAEETIEILKTIKRHYESFHNVSYSDSVLEEAVRLSNKYINNRNFPDKAIDLIDALGSSKKLELTLPKYITDIKNTIERLETEKQMAIIGEDFSEAARLRDRQIILRTSYDEKLEKWKLEKSQKAIKVNKEDLQNIVAELTGISAAKLSSSDRTKIINLEAHLNNIIIGQNDAVKSISKCLRRNLFGIRDENKPMGSFIFLGASGVGKTYLAKNIAKHVFNDEEALIRVDMSEFAERHSASKLGGAPAGYVGYEDGGNFTEKVKRRPYSVILFDEVEKAHPQIMDNFLQILDDGIYTDSHGEVVSFKNTIIIMTSNLGIKKLQNRRVEVGFSSNGSSIDNSIKNEILQNEIKNHFKPEFLNRIDELILFNYLKDSEVYKIVSLELETLSSKLKEKNLKLTVSSQAIKFIANKGYDKNFGARPLKRVISDIVESPIADHCLMNDITSGTITIKYSKKNDNLSFTYKQ